MPFRCRPRPVARWSHTPYPCAPQEPASLPGFSFFGRSTTPLSRTRSLTSNGLRRVTPSRSRGRLTSGSFALSSGGVPGVPPELRRLAWEEAPANRLSSRHVLLALVLLGFSAACGGALRAADASSVATKAVGAGATAPQGLRADLSKEAFEACATQRALPADVRQALAAVLRQPELIIASGDEPANLGCVQGGSLPRHRLVAAAIGPRYAVVQYETGGIALMSHLVVLDRRAPGAPPLWSQAGARSIRDSVTLMEGLRSGGVWRPELIKP